MGEILAAMTTAHAFTLVDPADWDRQRELNRQGFLRRYQAYPPVHPRIAEEPDDAVQARYQHVADARQHLGSIVETLRPIRSEHGRARRGGGPPVAFPAGSALHLDAVEELVQAVAPDP